MNLSLKTKIQEFGLNVWSTATCPTGGLRLEER